MLPVSTHSLRLVGSDMAVSVLSAAARKGPLVLNVRGAATGAVVKAGTEGNLSFPMCTVAE